jgi:Cys-tRNA(Pro)/Cys-tRNA(Cys) deacylase
MPGKKTNAARCLDRLGVEYSLIEYEVDESDLSAESVARKVNLPTGQVFKTLVARGDRTGVLLACVPAGSELDLKAIAGVSGNKKVEMVLMKEIESLTGYIRGGVSPIGVRKHYPLYMDETAMAYPLISISAGMRGLQLLIDPRRLSAILDARIVRISRMADGAGFDKEQ